MSKTVIHCGYLLTMNGSFELFENGSIVIEKDLIKEIHPKKVKVPKAKVIDATDCIVMPGLINGHTHTPMTLFRGIADGLPLFRWLEEKILPLEQRWVNKDFVYDGTLIACAEMLENGITTFNDMYYFESEVARAANDFGMRAICAPTIIEHEKISTSVEEVMGTFLSRVKKFSTIFPAIAPHAIYDVGESSLRQILDCAQTHKLPIHIHLSETKKENEDCLNRFQKTPTKLLQQLGIFNSHVIAAHSVFLTPEDQEILKNAGAGVIHNPESNMKLGTEIAPITDYKKLGIPVGFGTDSVASNNNYDLIGEARTGIYLQSFLKGPSHYLPRDAVYGLTAGGAKALGLFDKIGSLEVGKKADIIGVNVQQIHMQPLYDVYSQLIFSARGSDVDFTMVDGDLLYSKEKGPKFKKDLFKIAKSWSAKIRCFT